MPATSDGSKNPTTIERASECELVVTRLVDAPARLVWEAWTKPELFARWWVPRSFGMTLVSCELDVRVGGTYRLLFAQAPGPFHGRYLEVVPPSRLVWTNEEGGDGGSVTTATFEEIGGKTRVVVRERYPTKEALEANAGAEGAMPEAFDQLDELLATLR